MQKNTTDVFIKCDTLLGILKNVTDHERAYLTFLKEHFGLSLHEMPDNQIIRIMYNFTDNHESGAAVVYTTKKERLLQ